MPYNWNYAKVPDITKIGTAQHRNAVKSLYRRTLKHFKYTHCILRYDLWDYHAMRIREHFQKCKTMEDPGEVGRLMKELEVALDTYEEPDMYCKPWDGPKGTALNRYPPSPEKRFEHREADVRAYYDQAWVDEPPKNGLLNKKLRKQEHDISFSYIYMLYPCTHTILIEQTLFRMQHYHARIIRNGWH